MKKVGVVVLNYNKYNETIRCVNSLLQQSDVTMGIAIVDNGSTNDSSARITNEYSGKDNVFIEISKENLGFARGMNLGICRLRKEGFDYIFLANSDLVFSDESILAEMVSIDNENIGVISPFIQNADGSVATFVSFKKRFMELRMIKTYIEGMFKPIIKRLRKTGMAQTSEDASVGRKTQVLRDKFELTGCGYMLTPHFFKHYSGLYPMTFLYNEEYAICLYLKKAGLGTAWADTKPVIHKHGASTPAKNTWSKEFKRKLRRGGRRTIIRLMFMHEKDIVRKYN